MLIKSADDKSKRLKLLDDLKHAHSLDERQKKWLNDEYWRVKQGIEGERDAAYYIDAHFKDAQNHVILHDLRLICDGEVAQIDHLVIARGFIFYLLETKAFNGNLVINEQGEFTVNYGSRQFGIESPIEQSKRHEAILMRVLDKLGISGRVQSKPNIQYAILLHPKSVITRPDPKRFNTSNVIKADQFGSWRKTFVDKEAGIGAILGVALNIRSLETVAEWGQMLKRQHQPKNILELPDFMRPKPQVSNIAPTQQPIPNKESASSNGTGARTEKRLICATCGAKITYPEGKFCWNLAERFGGKQYCRSCQAAFR